MKIHLDRTQYKELRSLRGVLSANVGTDLDKGSWYLEISEKPSIIEKIKPKRKKR